MNISQIINNIALELSSKTALRDGEAIAVQHLARRIASGERPIALCDGVELVAKWFDYDNSLLLGTIKTKAGRIPLLDQRIFDITKDGEVVELQTREQACEALAQNAKSVITRLIKEVEQ